MAVYLKYRYSNEAERSNEYIYDDFKLKMLFIKLFQRFKGQSTFLKVELEELLDRLHVLSAGEYLKCCGKCLYLDGLVTEPINYHINNIASDSTSAISVIVLSRIINKE